MDINFLTKNDSFERNIKILGLSNPILAGLCCGHNKIKKNVRSHIFLQYDVDVLFVHGVDLYSTARTCSAKNLVLLEDDLDVLCGFLSTDIATEALKNPKVQLYYLDRGVLEKRFWDAFKWPFTGMKFEVFSESQELARKVKEFLKKHNNLVEELISGVFYDNFYSNLLELPKARSGCQLFGKFRGTPAIICGAGPSLSKQFPMLKVLLSRSLIFGGGSSINSLVNNGVGPHFGVSIDPNDTQYERQKVNNGFETPIFYRNRLHRDVLKNIHASRLFINGCVGYEIASYVEDYLGIGVDDIIDEGNNVINFCTEIAVHLGCDPIIFVGMDLAFTNMQKYTAGIVEDNIIKDEENSAFLKDDIYGDPVYTVRKWVDESKWLSKYVKKRKESTFINATEGGIGFEGVVNMPLKKASEEYMNREYNLYDYVRSEIMRIPLLDVKYENIVSFLEKHRKSLKICCDIIDKMIEEVKNSGKYVLLEMDLFEEEAYQQIIAPIVPIYDKMYKVEVEKLKSLKLLLSRSL